METGGVANKKLFSSFRWGSEKKNWELMAIVLLFSGLFILPVNLRFPFFRQNLGFFAYINYITCVALIILFLCKREYTKLDILLIGLLCSILVPLLISSSNVAIPKTVVAIFNCWLPMFFILFKIEKENIEKVVGTFLLLYDVFIGILLCLAIAEAITGGVVLKWVVSLLGSHGLKCEELIFLNDFTGSRFASVWGHPLTNAILFNAFFILNDIYYRSIEKRYPKLLFFFGAMLGVLLCAGKTAFVVLVLYVVVSNWKQKKWFILYGIVSVLLYIIGAFDQIINRFSNGSLTTGRAETMMQYFSEKIYPLQFWRGYGTGTVYNEEMNHLKAGFEFPLMMFSLDYGILFAFVLVGTAYLYASYYFLRKRQIVSWIGYSLLYVQINTYNGISLYNQDICCMLCVFTLVSINCAELCLQSSELNGVEI